MVLADEEAGTNVSYAHDYTLVHVKLPIFYLLLFLSCFLSHFAAHVSPPAHSHHQSSSLLLLSCLVFDVPIGPIEAARDGEAEEKRSTAGGCLIIYLKWKMKQPLRDD